MMSLVGVELVGGGGGGGGEVMPLVTYEGPGT